MNPYESRKWFEEKWTKKHKPLPPRRPSTGLTGTAAQTPGSTQMTTNPVDMPQRRDSAGSMTSSGSLSTSK